MLVLMIVRCLIVDDNAAFGAAATSLLDGDGMSVVGVAQSGDEAVRQVVALRPELAIVDVNLGEESGFDIARRLASEQGVPKVILISADEAEDFEELIAASPALGFISKDDLSAAAVLELLNGGIQNDTKSSG